MSILLDALRKSEQSQRRGTVPTLDTAVAPSPPSRRVPAWLPWALLACVVVAGGAAWWLAGLPTARTADPPPEVVPVVGDRPVARAGTSPETRPEPAAGPAQTRVEALPATVAESDGDAAAGAAADAGDAAAARAQRPTPAETGTPVRSASTSAGRTPVERAVAPLENAAPQAAETPAPGGESAPAPGASVAPATDVAERASADGARPAREVPDPVTALEDPPPAEAGPYEGEPVGVWALPQDVRARLPEFRISVLVYAARPADRFALVNGKRLGEGDSLAAGLELAEIRRDGAVFTFERYRFLVGR